MTKILKRSGGGGTTPARVPARARPRPAGVLPAAVYDAERDARAVREEAERLAAEIISRAQAEADALRAEAERCGREEGLAKATELVAQAHAEHDRILAGAEEDLRSLAVSISEKVLHEALALDATCVTSVCAAALEQSRAASALVLEVNPEDVPLVEAARARLEAVVGRRDAFVVRPVESIPRGGCVVESSLGRVDARLETQLAAIRKALETT